VCIVACSVSHLVLFFNATATTSTYTLSLHDALPISVTRTSCCTWERMMGSSGCWESMGSKFDSVSSKTSVTPSARSPSDSSSWRSEEHTSELQSRFDLVCRLLLEKKKTET